MKTLIIPCVVVMFFLPSSLIFSQEQASTSATVPTATFQENFSTMLSTFPQKVLATVNTIVVNSTNASSAAEIKDSLLKKDNVALQMGMWSSGGGSISAKYWLTELTALRIGVHGGLGAELKLNTVHNGGIRSFSMQRDTMQPSTGYSVLGGMQPAVASAVDVNCGVSATIEKHIFAGKQLSPFIGFSVAVNVFSDNELGYDSESRSWADSNGTGGYVGNSGYFVQPNTRFTGTNNALKLYTTTIVTGSGAIFAGVEYFALPFISITAQAAVSASISGNFHVTTDDRQSIETFVTNRLQNYDPRQMNNYRVFDNAGRSSFRANGGVFFSSALTLSVYFGRNALGDIVNAFKSGTLFQW